MNTSDRKDIAQRKSFSRHIITAGHLVSVCGVLLLFYVIKKAGAGEVVEGVKRIGAGFILVLATHGLKLIIRSVVWMISFEEPRAISFRDAFEASVIGDALGNLIPFGTVVGEPAKALLVRHRVPLFHAFSALVIENALLGFSVITFLFFGTAVLLFGFPLNTKLRIICLITLIVAIAVIAGSVLVLRRRLKLVSKTLKYLSRRGIAQNFWETRRLRVSTFEDRIFDFNTRHRKRLIIILLLVGFYQLTGVLDAYLILIFISRTQASILTAFLIESVHVVINIAFSFVPMRAGVDEAGTGMLTKILDLSTGVGVTLAIIRKGRELCWIALGAILLARRGLSIRNLIVQASTIQEEQTLKADEPIDTTNW